MNCPVPGYIGLDPGLSSGHFDMIPHRKGVLASSPGMPGRIVVRALLCWMLLIAPELPILAQEPLRLSPGNEWHHSGPARVDQAFFQHSTFDGARYAPAIQAASFEIPAIPPGGQQFPPNQSSTGSFIPPDIPLQPSPAGQPILQTPLFAPGPLPIPNVTQPVPPGYSFRFMGAPWNVVLRQVARDFNCSLDMRQPPPGTLTYFDENSYSATEFFDILNDHLVRDGFLLARNGRKLTLVHVQDPIDDGAVPFLSLNQLDGLGRNELASVAFPYELISEGGLAEIQQLLSPMGRLRPLANSRRVIVTDTGAYLCRIRDLISGTGLADDQTQTVVFRLKNAPALDAAIAINNILMSKSGISVPPMQPGAAGGPPAPPSGPMMVVPEPVTNRLFARGSPKELEIIHQLVCDIDAPPPQVFIQALLVEVQLGSTDEFGVEVGVQDSVLFNRSVVNNLVTLTQTVTNTNGSQTTNQNVISQTSTPGFNFNNQPLGNNTTVSPATVGTQGLANLGVGRVNGDLGYGGLVLSASSESVSVLLRALSAKHHIDILSRPQIRTLDNHEAVIQIGQQVPVVDGVAITAVGSANPVIRQDQAGIILRVLPRIGQDGLVQMNVNAEKSAFQLAAGTGVPIFTDATNGNVIEAPVKDVTSAETVVSARTGQTIVLGGMITRDHASVTRKVPWLGDIPVIGMAFRYDSDKLVRKELLIFLTPHILLDENDESRFKQVEVERIDMPWEPALQMHGPILDEPMLLPENPLPPDATFPPGGPLPPPEMSGPELYQQSAAQQKVGVSPAAYQPPVPASSSSRDSGTPPTNRAHPSPSTPAAAGPPPAAVDGRSVPAASVESTQKGPKKRNWKAWAPLPTNRPR